MFAALPDGNASKEKERKRPTVVLDDWVYVTAVGREKRKTKHEAVTGGEGLDHAFLMSPCNTMYSHAFAMSEVPHAALQRETDTQRKKNVGRQSQC